MDTYTPTIPSAAPSLTTAELQRACAQADTPVTDPQLARWVKAGLIPSTLRTAHGRGRGLGKEWRWQPEALVRALVIAWTINAGSDPSLTRSAAALAAAGYAPGAEMLRVVLLSALDVAEATAGRRQSYLDAALPPQEKRKRHRKSYRRRNPSLPDDLTSLLVKVGEVLHGLAPEDEQPPVPSFATMRDRLTTLDGTALLAAYEKAGRLLPTVIPIFFHLLNTLLIPLLALRFPEDKRGSASLPGPVDVSAIRAGLRRLDDGRIVTPPDSPAGTLRMALTFALAVVPYDAGVEQGRWDFARTMLSLLGKVVGQSDPCEKGGVFDID